jgi:hypothetical protein
LGFLIDGDGVDLIYPAVPNPIRRLIELGLKAKGK